MKVLENYAEKRVTASHNGCFSEQPLYDQLTTNSSPLGETIFSTDFRYPKQVTYTLEI